MMCYLIESFVLIKINKLLLFTLKASLKHIEVAQINFVRISLLNTKYAKKQKKGIVNKGKVNI